MLEMAPGVRSWNNVLSSVAIDSIMGLSEVSAAKQQIDEKSSGSVYFSVHLTSEIKSVIYDTLGLDLSAVENVPMRWMKGDTAPHKDTGAAAFDNTYLMYLTDSAGDLVVDGQSYPISQGSAYVFPESLMHETQNTGLAPRLLLGPMSETGFAVGFSLRVPGGTTVYFRQTTDIEWSTDKTNWNAIGNNYPLAISNNNTSLGVVKIEFLTDITFDNTFGSGTSKYFILNTSDLQFGSSSLKTNGTRPVITIDGVTGYPGLIRNGSDGVNGYSNIYIYNLEVNAINGSTLYNNTNGAVGGWIGHYYFGKAAANNYIINCSSNGPIPYEGGGIVGSRAGGETGATLTIIGCSSSGDIGEDGGGITGFHAGINSGSLICDSCFSTGIIAISAGGIIGSLSDYAAITNCYSTGTILRSGGGICGERSGISSRIISITNCYSTGSIGNGAGGIAGPYSGTVIITNCYSLGNMANSESGGIIGVTTPGGQTITNCYTVGSVVGSQGYITGLSATVPSTCYSEAKTGIPGTWSTTNANSVLLEFPAPIIGNTWISTGSNQPYELYNMGYSPYTIQNIDTTAAPALNRVFSATVAAGGSTPAAIVSGKAYTILQIVYGDSGSYNTLSINSTSGEISTTSLTVASVYTLYIRNNGSYNITRYIITTTSGGGGGGGGGGEVPCCEKPMYISNLVDNTIRTELRAGNVLVGSTRRPGPISYDEIMARKKANASKR